METFAHLMILCLLFGPNMLISAHRVKTPYNSPPPINKDVYVTQFGAVGDGKRDDSNAFESAWKAACNIESDNTKITVPSGKTFLVSEVAFEGPCKSRFITFEILSTIVAPPRLAWRKRSVDAWLHFHKVDGLIVVGNGQGVIDGKGYTWWKYGETKSRPTALRFSHCNKLHVSGLTFKDSQKNHLSITAVTDATISGLQMYAPQRSPNTDGIDISSSTNIRILNSIMATGDDCIAINGGTSNVMISNIACGPGHGISIGSLGHNGQHDEVQAIHINNCTFKETDNGVRIKTWQGGSGFARNITFSNIKFIAAKNPVIIDQYYCPHKQCTNKKSAVKVSDVRYTGLYGTFIGKNATINFSCSQTVPCTNIVLEDVDIRPADPHYYSSCRCINAHGKAHTLSPSVNCLKN